MDTFLLNLPSPEPTWAQMTLNLLMAYILSMSVAAFYRWSHAGLSYSRGFVHTMVLGAIVTCMLIMAIGNNLARGLGILGTLAIIRFRTPIRDPRDIIFLFACLGIGIAVGSGVYTVAIMGTLAFCVVAFFLHVSPFASQREHEGLLRVLVPADTRVDEVVETILHKYCQQMSLVASREAMQGDAVEYAYQIRLLDPSYHSDLLDDLREEETVQEVNLLMQRSTVEL